MLPVVAVLVAVSLLGSFHGVVVCCSCQLVVSADRSVVQIPRVTENPLFALAAMRGQW